MEIEKKNGFINKHRKPQEISGVDRSQSVVVLQRIPPITTDPEKRGAIEAPSAFELSPHIHIPNISPHAEVFEIFFQRWKVPNYNYSRNVLDYSFEVLEYLPNTSTPRHFKGNIVLLPPLQ